MPEPAPERRELPATMLEPCSFDDMPEPTTAPVTAECLARLFHDTYERLAPQHGYETRKASAVPWEDVPAANKSLMVAVAGHVLAALAGVPGDLPARMAEALNSHEWEPGQRHTAHRKHNYHGVCAICQEDLPRLAEVMASVRWEHDAAQAVEVERLRTLAATCTCGSSIVDYEGPQADCPVHGAVRAYNEAQAELAEVKRTAETALVAEQERGKSWAEKALRVQAERDALKAAIERFRHRHRPVEPDHPTGGPLCAWCRTAHPCAELAALDAPETPGDAEEATDG
jgi:hypothetical protein